jgi:RHS repeat-associated protein
VTNGVKYFYDGTLVPGQQFGYLFDDIGNRKQTTAGGDAAGLNLRVANYTNNSLNQITARDYPGTNDVIGVALATNSVTVNGQTAWRKGEYFQATVKTNNTAAAHWLGVTVASGGTTNTGNLFVPKTPEQFSYDADGNLTNDGRWSYVWDAENRLIQMTVNTNVGPQYQLTFAYDSRNRRIQKTVSTNGVGVYTNRFLYDGWNLVAELKPNNTLIRSYVWGLDLSGSLQGAGGVGGLLAVSYYGSATTNCFPAFDGNGNVMAYINAADGTSVAQLEYDPFLGIIRATGPLANVLPHLGSTKYYDWETGLYYYGHRYYGPSWGGWPNHDPIGERGGINLYGFVQNDGINTYDILGLKIKAKCIDPYLNGLGLKVGVDYAVSDEVYTALIDANDGDSLARKIVIRMMKSGTTFTIAGDSKSENIKNLQMHVGAREKVVNYTGNFRPEWDENGNGKITLHPDKGESWDQWFIRMNNPNTKLRCASATGMILMAASEGNILGRKNDHIFIPGDWLYVANEAWDSTWPTGYEGENMICVDVGSNDMFWGFPYKAVKSLQDWKDFIRNQFPKDAGVSGPGIPVEGRILQLA